MSAVRLSDAELGWAAGVVDGEGCIRIATQKSMNSKLPQYSLILDVSNTDLRLVERMHELFGGSIHSKTGNQIRRPIYGWRVFSTRCGEVLELLRPYLVIKGEQADIAIEFAKTLKRVKTHSEEVHEARRRMKAKIAVLKREEAV